MEEVRICTSVQSGTEVYNKGMSVDLPINSPDAGAPVCAVSSRRTVTPTITHESPFVFKGQYNQNS